MNIVIAQNANTALNVDLGIGDLGLDQ